eukprot:scaffold68_cov340-Pavlova_lutheri.AAC.52
MEGQGKEQEASERAKDAGEGSSGGVEVLPHDRKVTGTEAAVTVVNEKTHQEVRKESIQTSALPSTIEGCEEYNNAWAAILDRAALICAGIMISLMVSCAIVIVLDPPNVNTSLQNFEAKSEIGETYRSLQLASQDTAEAYREMEPTDTKSRRLEGSGDKNLVKWTLNVIFSRKDGTNMILPQPLLEVREIEDQIKRFDNYQTICAHNSSGSCAKPDSILNFFLSQTDDRGQLQEDWVEDVARKLAASEILWYTDASFSTNSLESSYLRSTFFFSVPDSFVGWEDRMSEQEAHYKNWISARLPDLLELSTDTIQVNWAGEYITEHEIWVALLGDLKLCLIGVSLIALYCAVHFDSVFLATFGVIQIILSFPLGFLVHRYVFGIHEVGMLEFLGFFLVLGIGIDDIFIFYGSYKLVSRFPEETLERRLGYVFSHAGSSMLVTTCTSAMAFGANIFSTIPALQSFGLFMSLLVFINFFLVLCWFPSFLCIWEKYVRGTRADFAPVTAFKHLWARVTSCLPVLGSWLTVLQDFAFTWDRYFMFIQGRRYLCLILTSSVVTVFAVFASQMKPSEEFARFFPESHNIHFVSVMFDQLFLVNRQVYRGERPPTDFTDGGSSHGGGAPSVIDGPFTGADSYANTELITLSWGLRGISGYSSFGIGSEGSTQRVAYDDTFNISSETAQQALVDLCAVLGEKESLVKEVQRCFMSSFASWKRQTTLIPEAHRESDVAFPVPAHTFPLVLVEWLNERSYWKRTRDVGYTGLSFPQPSYVKIMVRTVLSKSLRATEASFQYNQWNAFLSNWSRRSHWDAPPPKISSPLFVRMATEKAAIHGLLQSLIVSIVSVILALLIFTRSLIISALAGITVASITTVILGFMKQPLGWSIGAIESVSLTFMVGLTVDYVLHLAKHYLVSKHISSVHRAKSAFTELGPSILASAVTTILGVVPLLFCTILAFVKVGLIVMLSITATLMLAFHLFMPLLLFVGNCKIRPLGHGRKIQRLGDALFGSSLRAFNVSFALLLVCSVSITSVRTYLYGNTGQTGIVLYFYASCISLDISRSTMERLK